MLPYHLREIRNIDKKGNAKGRRGDVPSEANANNDNTVECGGPVQRAITSDLVNLRRTFRERLLVDHVVIQKDDFSTHWKAGTAFSIFKTIFGSLKMAMLHLLSPARCDREAYSQLIYAACLALFKDSFTKIGGGMFAECATDGRNNDDSGSSDNHYDDACFAIFYLFALFETNPLPRKFRSDNPLRLLSVSLRSSDDPNTSHRRCFSKNIRIDREHFALLLQLKELSLAKKCDCERSLYYEQQRFLLRGSKRAEQGTRPSPNTEEHHHRPWKCSCGLSTDVLEILDRVFDRLELCEYTGPLGAEAFAGHSEYPHGRSVKRPECSNQNGDAIPQRCLWHEARMDDRDSFSAEPKTDYSNEINALIGNYENSVAAIRVPSQKSNGVQHLRGKLEALFSKDSSRSRSTDPSTQSVGNQNETQEALVESSVHHPDISRRYRIAFRAEIRKHLRKQLRATVTSLLGRDEPIPPPSQFKNNATKSLLDRDDVSSIGLGGISVRTGRGGAGIQKEPSGLGRNASSRKSRSNNEVKVITNPNLANMFFLTTNTHEKNDSAACSSDNSSVDSEISMLSSTDGDGIEDGISVATSAFGKRALDDLLQKVTQEGDGVNDRRRTNQRVKRTKERKGKKQANGTKQKSSIPKGGKKEDEMSVATSTYGKKALDDLLRRVTEEGIGVDKEGVSSRRRKNQVPGSTKGNEEENEEETTAFPGFDSLEEEEEEEISVATSAFGKRALDDLLQSAAREGDVVNRKRKKNQKARSTT
eukprot:CAMPEP_0172361268 /NCGR_PEP_ID=MMETSP1060-20121228/5126_1 /TAXON_ID=37318 /ORGANISM="Pseudo-nitzschia pungens, Strain cf. cingulata" /LENGTH=759 /DNA_ID=CAMNT_0013083481 /DNA_START=165 /DNA_END=2441 /DNA_ORIENTATION=+